jgi:protein-tyrosine phosphatase
MRAILCDLYLGDRHDASNVSLLRENQITHVVNCAADLANPFPGEFCYLSLEMEDPDERFVEVIPESNLFIDQARERGRVLVHCRKGLSRSPSIIMAYLGHMGFRFDQALEHILLRADIGPHSYFLRYLQQSMRPSIQPKRAEKWLRKISKDKRTA